MLFPSRTKYRKVQRRTPKFNAQKCEFVAFGEYGLISLDNLWIKDKQIEAARVAINKKLPKGGKLWIRIFPDKPYTRKGEGVRMGKGKGNPEGWVAPVRSGRVLFEINGVTEDQAKEIFELASHKLPVKVKMIKREEI